uniref:FBA_2 domain-containing protein n=1 Tax=Caenorhabditis tropicalis TaxID=1561998 RepID=A0A1I7TT74_9PELO
MHEIFVVFLWAQFCIRCVFYNGNTFDDVFQKVVLSKVFEFDNRLEQLELTNEKWQIKDWVDHFRIIFHQRYIGFNALTENVDIPPIVRRLKVVDTLISYDGEGRQAYSLINRLSIALKVTPTQDFIRNTLIQNFKRIAVKNPKDTQIVFGLDEFLTINSISLTMCKVNVSLKSINRFLKFWKKGACHQIERLVVCHAKPSEFDVFQGIDGVFSTETRSFNTRELEGVKTIESGYDIVREDGTKATCVYKLEGSEYIFEMYVWYPFC